MMKGISLEKQTRKKNFENVHYSNSTPNGVRAEEL